MRDDPESDRRFMHAALSLGRRRLGRTAPNPCVGALVVRNGIVIGRGVTAPGGRPHAEPQALAQAGQGAAGATMVVTLEPCSHHGHTMPCADAIVAAGVARVVVAMLDPDERVAGRGVERLRRAGIAVTVGVCQRAARHDHLGHIRRMLDQRPMVTLKLAETADGFASGASGRPRLMITGEAANAWVHRARSMHDAVLVGAGTARQDDPLLTVRLPRMDDPQPLRVVLATSGDLAPTSRLAQSAARHPVLLVTGPEADPAGLHRLRSLGVGVATVGLGPDGRLDLGAALRALAGRGLTRVFCEGGPRLGQALLAEGFVDDVVLFTGATTLGAPGRRALDDRSRAILADAGFRLIEDRMLADDRLRIYERGLPCSPD